MKTTLGRLARLVNGTVLGNKDISIIGFSGIKEARTGDITFLANDKYLPLLKHTRASAVVVGNKVKVPSHLAALRVRASDLAFAQIAEYLSPKPVTLPKGVHPKAVVARGVKLGKQVSIQPYAVIQPGVKIGDHTVIYPNVYIGHQATIGKNCYIYPNVVIREKSILGNNVIIHSGTVIGNDGFGYTLVKKVRHKIPQTGIVVIEDDVEIGANTTIDRARFDKTIIGQGTKIDNLTQIAHNVVIGKNSILVAQVGIAGSSRIGENVIFAGQSGTTGHLQVGDNTTIAGRAVATKDIPPNSIYSGFPAQPHDKEIRMQVLIRKLPQLAQTIKKLQDEIKRLKIWRKS